VFCIFQYLAHGKKNDCLQIETNFGTEQQNYFFIPLGMESHGQWYFFPLTIFELPTNYKLKLLKDSSPRSLVS
jgi:hypothetical protein